MEVASSAALGARVASQRNLLAAVAAVLLFANVFQSGILHSSGTKKEPSSAATLSAESPAFELGDVHSLTTGRRLTQAMPPKNTTTSSTMCPISLDPCMAVSDSSRLPKACLGTGPNMYEELSAEEAKTVWTYIMSKKDSLKLDAIFYVEFLPPAKAEALAFLAGKGPRPIRSALAVVHIKGPKGLIVNILKVSPVSKPTSIEKLPLSAKKLEAPFPKAPPHLDEIYKKVTRDANKIAPVLTSLYDGVTQFKVSCKNTTGTCLQPLDWSLPWSVLQKDGSFKVYRVMFHQKYYNGEGLWPTYAHPAQLVQYVYDINTLELVVLWSLGKFYNSTDELLSAFRSATPTSLLKSTVVPWSVNQEYATFKPRAKPRNAAQPLAAIPYDPYGHRFTIRRNSVSWMGWSLEVGMARMGPRFFDVRFKGERIIYELAGKEFTAGYGGPDVYKSHITYYDGATWYFGWETKQLVQGVDCPLNAAFMNMPLENGTLTTRAVCVFEKDTTMPVLVHSAEGNSYSGGGAIRGTSLVIRTRHTVGNYDYYHDTTMFLDGTLSVIMVASGYMDGNNYVKGVYDSYSEPAYYGYGGGIHDHIFHWKVDLDVLGTKNSVRATRVVPEVKDDFFTGGKVYTKKLSARIVQNETDGQFVFDPKKPMHLSVIAPGKMNKYGGQRSYSISLNRFMNDVVDHDAPQMKSRSWVKKNVVFTNRKEAERFVSFNSAETFPNPPIIDFEKDFLDGEPLEGVDLVAWITTGVYHFVHSEDQPVTPTSGQDHAGFTLRPHSYFDENAAMDAADIYYSPPKGPTNGIPLIHKFVASTNKCKPNFPLFPIQKAEA